MARNPFLPERKRGGSAHRASRKEFIEPTHHESTAGVVANGSSKADGTSYTPAMFECADTNESIETHLIPRKSLTNRLHLKIFAPERDTETMQGKQLAIVLNDKGKKVRRLVEVTYQRQTWRQDRTLLRTNKPDAFGEGGRGSTFARVTSHSKRREYITEHKDAPQGTVTLGPYVPPSADELDIDLLD